MMSVFVFFFFSLFVFLDCTPFRFTSCRRCEVGSLPFFLLLSHVHTANVPVRLTSFFFFPQCVYPSTTKER